MRLSKKQCVWQYRSKSTTFNDLKTTEDAYQADPESSSITSPVCTHNEWDPLEVCSCISMQYLMTSPGSMDLDSSYIDMGCATMLTYGMS